MPKSAVLLSNHFRTFPLISDRIKEFYGPDVDYYASLWDHDHDLYTHSERLKMLEGHLPIAYHTWYKGSCLPYMYLDLNNAIQYLNDFGVKDTVVTTADEYDLWCGSIDSKITYTSWWEKFFRFGSLYNKYMGWKLIESTGINYDIIYYHRFDILNFVEDKNLTLKQAFDDIHSLDWEEYLGVAALSLNKGWPRIADRFFYTSSNGSGKLFNNLTERINSIINNPLFQDTAQDFFTTHKILGALLLTSRFERIRKTPFVTSTIHKSTVEDNFNLDDFDSCEKHHYEYKGIIDNRVPGSTTYTRNLWAQKFFKEFIDKYGGH